jgi:uncharacterized protein YfaS (alpha-2-macroglobulin family)
MFKKISVPNPLIKRYHLNKITSLSLSFLFFILFFNACSEKKHAGEISYSLETAKMVSQATSGLISSTDAIQVVFVADMIKKEQVGKSLKKKVFEFDPSIDGIAQWKDRRTLIFKPNRALPFKEIYNGKLDLNALFPQFEDKKLKPLMISFQAAGREIGSFSGDFKLHKENDPNLVILEGKITFTEKTDLSDLKRAARLRMNGKGIKLNWTASADEKEFSFTTQVIKRTKKEKQLALKIDKSKISISYDYERKFTLPALKDFKVVDIIKEDDGKQPSLKVEFSDELDARQDITGFISIKPEMDVQLKMIDKQALVRGNFEHGKEYTLIVQPGIRSRWATVTEKVFEEKVQFEDMLPEIRFANDGVFLPSSNQKKIAFQTVNVSRVQLKIIKVFESNLGQFLQMERLDGAKDRRDYFNYNIKRVGVKVAGDTLLIGNQRNRWLQHELDLNKLIKPGEKGLFLLDLSFKKEDMLYDTSEDNLRYNRRRSDWYYNDPSSYGYLYRHGKIFKPIILSDIGLTYKKAYKSHYVYATDLIDTKPLSGVKVLLKTYQNQFIAQSVTDNQGKAEFKNINQNVFYVEAETDGRRSVIKPNEMAWNLSTFETNGVEISADGTRAFIYTERGVYRPGDAINLSVIVRNENNTFPENHPVTLKVYNPKNQIIYKETNRNGTDGFYNFTFKTKQEDLTGAYLAKIQAGSRAFTHTIKIETVVPERLKVMLDAGKKQISCKERSLNLSLSSIYLFGNPASGLDAELSISLYSVKKAFKKYSNYTFINEAAEYRSLTSTIFKGKLDVQGKADIKWTLPSFDGAPCAIQADLQAKVLEKGGRASKNRISLDIDPYPYYVGMQEPELEYWYASTGQELKIPVILLNPQGKETAGKALNYRIYKNQRHWWWEYNSRDQYRLRYKKDVSTELVAKGNLVSGNTPVILTFKPEERGEYLIEVQDGNGNGHTSAFFISAYPWGDTPSAGKDAGILALKSDKEKYHPGEDAVVSFPIPKKASILVTVEKGKQVLQSKWYQADGESAEKKITIPVTQEMLPTAYVSVSVIQPHAQTANDRPLRMYGIVPLNVEEASTRQELTINMPDELQSKKKFEVQVQTADKKATQLTIAVVDEGLLSLTRFKTPDPWKTFFKKQRLDVETYDLFSHVIGANKGDIFKTFSIGGGLAGDEYRESQLEQQKAKRFKPVAMFKGPIMTDSNGKVSVSFDMPNYIGAVRVMAVAAKGNCYGHKEKTVPVKTDLMVMPTLPRVIGPRDKIIVPVTVFAMKDNIGAVDVSLKIEGPLQLQSASVKKVNFKSAGEKEVKFTLQAKAAVGKAKIIIEAVSSKMKSDYKTEIAVRSSSPRISEAQEKEIQPSSRVSFIIPDKGMPGSNQAKISVRRRPNLKLTHRILWLIRYPYGCIEQNVSAVFPQLYLKEFIPKSRAAKRDIDKNINMAINRLRKFQLASGAFAYWPGNSKVSTWGTSYAGHFMIEAKKLGYNVPEDLLAEWLRYEKSQALKNDDNLMVKVYRVYLLALAGKPQLGPMNLLKENQLNKMNDVQKWLLAAAYKLAGVDKTANKILISAGTSVKDYQEFAGTYGSALRDKAVILDQMVLFERWEEANKLADELATVLSTQEWYSTQSTGFMLLSMGKYFKALEGDKDKKLIMTGQIILPDGKKVDFNTDKISYDLDITSGFGKKVQVVLNEKTTTKRAFVILEWSGLPLQYTGKDESHNLELQVEWLDEDGITINPENLVQGKTFWAHFKVNKPEKYRSKIEELALMQILPAGWEIENTRLSNENTPNWMSKWRLNREEYLDIRDDRVMWFFDMERHSKQVDFAVKINAVTVGEFFLPPTLLEAMYNHNYRASKAGKKVVVRER